MHVSTDIEKAEAYLNLHASHSGPGFSASPSGPFITLSREAGAGASTFARLLAHQLNHDLRPSEILWRIFDGNLVESMLSDQHYPARLARFLPEDNISPIDASIGEIIGLHPDLWTLEQKTNCLMRQLAAQGHCILIGRGANFATASLPHGLHLRLIADQQTRAQHMAQHLNISFAKAMVRNEKADAARRRYVHTHFEGEIDDPSAYDLILNLGHLQLTEVVSLIAHLVRTRCPVEAI